MSFRLKPLAQQRLVVTGASSGIGLATARAAAKAGAEVLLVARDEDALRQAASDIRAEGGRAEYAIADVGEERDVERVVQAAVDRLGGFDTWVNDAGVSIYGELQALDDAEHRKLFDTNYWGMVHGSKAAVAHFKARGIPGALINIGSVASDIPSPLLGAYVASKHAVKGYTNSLRIELLAEKAPISVTLIKPSGIATPFARNSRNKTDGEAVIPPPRYAPEVVAEAVLYAAANRKREITVGGAGRSQVLLVTHFPALGEKLSTAMTDVFSRKGRPNTSVDSLEEPGLGGQVHADGRGKPFSLYTAAQTHPGIVAGLGFGVLAGLAVGGAFSRPETRRAAAQVWPEIDRRTRKLAERLPREIPPEFGRGMKRQAAQARKTLDRLLSL